MLRLSGAGEFIIGGLIMAVDVNRVIVVALLVLMIGCSEKGSEQSSTANKSLSEKQTEAKRDLQIAELKQLEKRAAGGDHVAKLDLAKALLGNPALPDRFTRAKSLLCDASQKGLLEAKWGLVILLSYEKISGDGLPELATLRNEVFSAKDHFIATLIPESLTDGMPGRDDSILLFGESVRPILEQAAEAGSTIAKAEISSMYSRAAGDGHRCAQRKAAEALAVIAYKGSSFHPYVSSGSCRPESETRENAVRAIRIADALSEREDADAARYRFWKLLQRELLGALADPSLSPRDVLENKYVRPKIDPYFERIAEAKRLAGYLLAEGVNGSVDFLSAFRSYEMAAKVGNSAAQHALGELYEGGKGVPKDFEMAARYFAQSAQQGNSNGATALGKAYLRGQGVPVDLTKAYFWLNVASMGTIPFLDDSLKLSLEVALQTGIASLIRDVLARRMEAEDISEAQRLTREWRPSFQNGAPAEIAVLARATDSSSANTKSLSKKGTGTLFLVNATGVAITNHHVVSGCGEVRIEGRDGLAKVVTEDAVNDLALVQIPGGAKSSAAIASEPGKLRQGEDIVAFGFPLNAVLSSGGNLTPGVVSALTGLGNNTNQIQITAPIQPGSSGSPVLNKKGEVVGVVSMKLSDIKMAKATGSVGQNVNFAVNGQTLKTFLDTHKVSYRSGSSFFSWDKSAADLADEARKWTLVVECWK